MGRGERGDNGMRRPMHPQPSGNKGVGERGREREEEGMGGGEPLLGLLGWYWRGEENGMQRSGQCFLVPKGACSFCFFSSKKTQK